MQCPRCQHENPPGMKFCGECAAPLAATCPSCGAANPADNKFCGQCATPLRTGPTAQEGVAASKTTGTLLSLAPLYMLALADALLRSGQAVEGLTAVDETLASMATSRVRVFHSEFHRLRGELLLARSPSDHAEAETCFRQAVDVARHQAAHGWELRAATSLGRLLGRQGKRDDARQTLADVYDRFTEGLDTADLREAKAMLEELS